jgi:hypothetical protein
MSTEQNKRLVAQRDELLEACKELLFTSRVVDTSENPTDDDINKLLDAQSVAQITIAKCEKE